VQAALGALMAMGSLLLAGGYADEAGVEDSLLWLVLLSTAAALALALLNEWVEAGRSPRRLSGPALVLLACAGPLVANALSVGGYVWLFLFAYAVGVAWAGLACYRLYQGRFTRPVLK
jgi:hypothetical protein